MNIHEYQAKAVLREFGVPVARGVAVFSPTEAEAAARELGGPVWVVKAQIHAGGRGKGRFKEKEAGDKGGVRLARSVEEVVAHAKAMLGRTLVTQQTGPDGRGRPPPLHRGRLGHRPRALPLLPRRPRQRPRRLHRLDRGRHGHRGSRGEDAGEDRHRPCRSGRRLQPYHRPDASPSASALPADRSRQCVALVGTLYAAFVAKDMSLLEINPLVVTKDGKLLCLDAKINFDDNALFRHPDIAALRDPDEEDPKEVEAAKIRAQLHRPRRHHRLHGQRRRPRHGDHGHHQALRRRAGQFPRCRRRRLEGEGDRGLQDHHRRPAASKASWSTSSAASCAATSSPKASSPRSRRSACSVPLVVRLEGTNVELGKKILAESGPQRHQRRRPRRRGAEDRRRR